MTLSNTNDRDPPHCADGALQYTSTLSICLVCGLPEVNASNRACRPASPMLFLANPKCTRGVATLICGGGFRRASGSTKPCKYRATMMAPASPMLRLFKDRTLSATPSCSSRMSSFLAAYPQSASLVRGAGKSSDDVMLTVVTAWFRRSASTRAALQPGSNFAEAKLIAVTCDRKSSGITVLLFVRPGTLLCETKGGRCPQRPAQRASTASGEGLNFFKLRTRGNLQALLACRSWSS